MVNVKFTLLEQFTVTFGKNGWIVGFGGTILKKA